jgi:hypothetical protein
MFPLFPGEGWSITDAITIISNGITHAEVLGYAQATGRLCACKHTTLQAYWDRICETLIHRALDPHYLSVGASHKRTTSHGSMSVAALHTRRFHSSFPAALGCRKRILDLHHGTPASRPSSLKATGMTSATSNVPAPAAGSARTALDETNPTGEFKRTEAGFRSTIEPGGRFEPEGTAP